MSNEKEKLNLAESQFGYTNYMLTAGSPRMIAGL